jgi:hypothetical protein
MRTILASVRSMLRAPEPDVGVHFHQGPGGRPAPCYDGACGSPRLHVDWR